MTDTQACPTLIEAQIVEMESEFDIAMKGTFFTTDDTKKYFFARLWRDGHLSNTVKALRELADELEKYCD